ncbi:hypothetical protein HZC35_07300 [Candidatus Saganbacteria bacterium]|nr:hypothetical protein [Candidatus Saganbacteria bacterium]
MSDLWAELFQVEPLLPRTVNNITGPLLNGNPVIIIIYLLVGLFIAGYAYVLWFKYKLNWEKVGRAGIMALLLFWIILEIIRSFSYLAYFSEDRDKFGGKTLAQKRSQVPPVGFYSFVEFVHSQVPRSAPVSVRMDLDQYSGMMWNYYAAPLNQTAEADAEYIIGINVEPIAGAELFVQTYWVAKR